MNVALILAGGKSVRMGGDTVKQLMPLCGEAVICHSIRAFQQHNDIDAIAVVCGNDAESDYLFLFQESLGFTKLMPLVLGGDTRKQSSFKGLLSIKSSFGEDCLVLIHDAARPLVSAEIITENIKTATMFGACTTAIPISDTLLVCCDGANFDGALDRSVHYLAQTPQTFGVAEAIAAHELASDDVTDDTSLFLESGKTVRLVLGSKRNLKLTTADDFLIAEAFLK